jgi:HEAT repeat protein
MILVALALIAVPLLAKEAKELIEVNAMIGLETSNSGLQRSCALMLGKLQSERAVIPLMTIFRNHPDENVRIAAAWALCKIGDARGVYAVKRAVKYDESPKVQSVCAWYYENLVKPGTFIFIYPKESVAVNMQ